MEKVVDKKFCWVIKNFNLFTKSARCSVSFLIGDCKWHLVAFPKRNEEDYLSLFLKVSDYESLPSGWGRYIKFRLSIVNQLSGENSVQEEFHRLFDQKAHGWGCVGLLPFSKLDDEKEGFLVNGEVVIFAEIIEVIEVIGTLDEPKEASEILSKIKENDCAKSYDSSSPVKKSVEVNGFQVLPSQVESVRRIFEKHPDIAVEFHVTNQHLRTTFMNFLLNIIETMCQSVEELSIGDLVEADIALKYLKDTGFQVGWLEKKMEEIKDKKGKERCGVYTLYQIEQQLRDLMQKCDKKKSEVLSVVAPLKFEDVV